jgi:PAS domain S-box-containing protein
MAMKKDTLNEKIQTAEKHLEVLQQRVPSSPKQHALLADPLQELSTTLKELRAAGEELCQQNEELAAACQAAEEERRYYQGLFDLAPHGYLVTDANGIIREANCVVARMLRVHQDFLVGKPLIVFVPQEEHQAFRTQLNRLQRVERVEDWKVPLQLCEGAPFPAAITVTAVCDPEGKLVALRWLIRDITEQKQIEEEREQFQIQTKEDRQRIEELASVLEQERNTLQNIMESTHFHLAYLDPQFNFVRVNSAYAQGSGHSKQELLGRNHFELFPNPENHAIFERVRDTGQPVEFRARPFEYADQPERGITYWDWTLVPVKGRNGQVQGLVLSLLDVTERERSRIALRQYADRLQVLHETDQAILAARSVQEIAESALRYVPQLLDCVRASVALFDLEAGEMSVLAVYSEGETQLGAGWRNPLTGAWIMEELGQGKTHAVEDIQTLSSSPLTEMLQAEGVRAYVNAPLIIQGELVGSLNVGRGQPGPLTPEEMDIVRELATQVAIGIQQARLNEQVRRYSDELEQLVAERTAELWVSEARFRAIFENTAMGISLADMKGRFLATNPALQEMLGYSEEELRGMVYTEFTHPDDVAASVDLYQELVAGGRDHYSVEKRYVRKDGRVIWGRLTASLVRGANGQPQYTIGMVEDITERKQAQEALIQSEKLAIAGKLAASLAHEINNPLQSVIGCLGLAEETLAEGGDVSHYLHIAHEELRRAASTVAQLRDLHRRSEPGEKEPTDVNALLEKVLMLSKKQCQDRRVEVVWKAADDLPPLLLAPDRVRQVFLNLVLNAVDAMPDGGQLQVATSRTDQPAGILVTFTDSGVGIAPNVVSHIFDPFYSTKPEGLGLGLFICQDIVKQHGGHMEVDSQVGEGTTFAVWLPE